MIQVMEGTCSGMSRFDEGADKAGSASYAMGMGDNCVRKDLWVKVNRFCDYFWTRFGALKLLVRGQAGELKKDEMKLEFGLI
ncbi:hypothetical protein TNCV_3233211 [Trichonephila clavipes]|nr:hypothetical protein TNCV_3233211 [Trichonephila clavipes]